MMPTQPTIVRTTRIERSEDGSRSGDLPFVACHLCAGGARFPVELPAHAVRLFEAADPLVLVHPSGSSIPIIPVRSLTESEQRIADRWLSEMQDFNRF